VKEALMNPRLKIVKHPLILQKLTIMRNKKTDNKLFRELLNELSALMAYEITRDVKLCTNEIETPLGKTIGYKLAKPIAIVPILRAGLIMADGILNLIPMASVGHIGIYRDEKTLRPVEYFCKLPKNINKALTLVIDPMLATEHSAAKSIEIIKERGGADIKFVCLISCPEGFKVFNKEHPDIDVYTAFIDEKLNKKGYIVPGLGDAGDRLFGTG